MKKYFLPTILSALLLPKLAFACGFGIGASLPFIYIFAEIAVIIFLIKKILDHLMGRRDIIEIRKFLIVILFLYMAWFLMSSLIKTSCYFPPTFIKGVSNTMHTVSVLFSLVAVVFLSFSNCVRNQLLIKKITFVIACVIVLLLMLWLGLFLAPDSWSQPGISDFSKYV